MKHILNITDFFNKISESKLSKSDIQASNSNFKSVRNFITKHKNDKNIWNHVFKGRNRIYFDMYGNEIDKKHLIKNSKEITITLNNVSDLGNVDKADRVIYHSPETIKEIVTKVLTELGYLYIDYDNNRCSKDKEGVKNLTSIAGILSRKNIEEVYKKIDLLNKYNQRNNKNVFNKPVIIKQKTVDDTKLMMVFSNHPVDLMTMSSNRPWEQTSCMRIGGSNHEYVYADIEYGSVVCFQTVFGDYNIEVANARLLYKPYVDTDDSDNYILYSDGKVYGDGKKDFYRKSLEVVNDTFNYGVEGTFNLHCSIYNDSQATTITKDGDYIEEANRINIYNFYEEYDSSDASSELYYELEGSAHVGSIDDYDILNTIFMDLNNGDKCRLLDTHLYYLKEFCVGDNEDSEIYRRDYLQPLIEIIESDECDNDDIRNILLTSYFILGIDFVFSEFERFEDYVFDSNTIKRFSSYDKDEVVKLKKLEAIKAIFEDETVRADYNKLNKIYDNADEDIESADNGFGKIIKNAHSKIELYKSKIKIKDNTLMVYVFMTNKKDNKFSEGFITIDSLVNYIYNADVI